VIAALYRLASDQSFTIRGLKAPRGKKRRRVGHTFLGHLLQVKTIHLGLLPMIAARTG
jgi:hypothetical protein